MADFSGRLPMEAQKRWVRVRFSSTTGMFGAGDREHSFGHGLGSSEQLTADVTGDGNSDTAYFAASDGRWNVGASSGSGFYTQTE